MDFWNFLGSAIEQICEETNEEVTLDRTLLVRAAKCLLAAITRVLLLADIVVVKQLLLAKDKVISSNLMARSLLSNLLGTQKELLFSALIIPEIISQNASAWMIVV